MLIFIISFSAQIIFHLFYEDKNNFFSSFNAKQHRKQILLRIKRLFTVVLLSFLFCLYRHLLYDYYFSLLFLVIYTSFSICLYFLVVLEIYTNDILSRYFFFWHGGQITWIADDGPGKDCMKGRIWKYFSEKCVKYMFDQGFIF